MLRINLIPQISTAENLKVKSPATTFSLTQGKTANSLVTKSQKMKYPTAKSLKMKKSACKNPLNRICNKSKLHTKNLTAKTPAVEKSTKEKNTCESFKSKGEICNSNITNGEKCES